MCFRIKNFGVILIIMVLAVSGCGAPSKQKSIKKMSNSKICAQATLSGEWETRSKYKSYVKNAKLRGLSCGVKTKKASCPSSLSACSHDIICTGARSKPYYGNQSASFWSDHPVFKSYTAEARSRGLSCNEKY